MITTETQSSVVVSNSLLPLVGAMITRRVHRRRHHDGLVAAPRRGDDHLSQASSTNSFGYRLLPLVGAMITTETGSSVVVSNRLLPLVGAMITRIPHRVTRRVPEVAAPRRGDDHPGAHRRPARAGGVAAPRRGDDHTDTRTGAEYHSDLLLPLVGATITRGACAIAGRAAHVAAPRRGDDHQARELIPRERHKVAAPRRGDDHERRAVHAALDKQVAAPRRGDDHTSTAVVTSTGTSTLLPLVGAMITGPRTPSSSGSWTSCCPS